MFKSGIFNDPGKKAYLSARQATYKAVPDEGAQNTSVLFLVQSWGRGAVTLLVVAGLIVVAHQTDLDFRTGNGVRIPTSVLLKPLARLIFDCRLFGELSECFYTCRLSHERCTNCCTFPSSIIRVLCYIYFVDAA